MSSADNLCKQCGQSSGPTLGLIWIQAVWYFDVWASSRFWYYHIMCKSILWRYKFWSKSLSSTSILFVCKQQRLWRVFALVQARLSLRCSAMWATISTKIFICRLNFIEANKCEDVIEILIQPEGTEADWGWTLRVISKRYCLKIHYLTHLI